MGISFFKSYGGVNEVEEGRLSEDYVFKSF